MGVFDPIADRLTGGEDWFEVMVYLKWEPGTLEQVGGHLDEVMLDVRDGDGDGWTDKMPCCAGMWKVEPHGCRLGEKGKGPSMRWCFARDGIKFGLTRREEPHDTLPSGFVRMTGDVLIAHGDARLLWSKVVDWFAELGAEVVTAKVSRVDMCVDLPDVECTEFVEAYLRDEFITRTKRSRQHTQHVEDDWDGKLPDAADAWAEGKPTCDGEIYRSGRRYTGLRLGAGTQLRIYDKLAECRDLAKLAWLAHRRWGGRVPDAATRVEFQLRRSFLTAEKVAPDDDGTIGRPVIDTVEDYFRLRADLVAYLTRRWVCFFAPGFDRRHPERAVISETWERVRRDFAAWAGRAEPTRYVPMAREEMPIDDLVKQAVGCIESAAARAGLAIDTADDLYFYMLESMQPVFDGEDRPSRVLKKMKALIRPVDVGDLLPI